MVPNPLKCRGLLCNHLPRLDFPTFVQRFYGRTCIEFKFAAFSSIAALQAFDDFPIEEFAKVSTESSLKFLSSQPNVHPQIQPGTLRTFVQKSYFQQVDGYQVFDDFPRRNLSEWNKLIAGTKSSDQAFKIFSRVLSEKVGGDGFSFAGILRACGDGKVSFSCTQQIHAKIVQCGFEANLLVSNPLIDLYSKNGFIYSAKQIFDNMSFRDSVTWVAMLSGLSYNEQDAEAIQLYSEMRRSGVLPTPYIFSSVLSACSKIEFYELGEQLHATVFKWGFSSEIFVCNALITLYSRSGKLLTAEYIFTTMRKRDRVSYNTLISGLARQEYSERSFELFEKMLSDGLKPDCVTVAGLLSLCTSVGALHKGRQLHSFTIKAGMCSDVVVED